MGIRTRGVAALVLAAIGLALAVVPAGSAEAADYVFPSTNDINRANGLPHVNEVSKGLGTVTLEFINTTNSQAFFEYRIDSQTAGTTPHPVVTGDVIHPGVCVDGRTPPECAPGPVTKTFTANTLVEIRLALGGERNWDFDWTPFTVGQPYVFPSTNDINRANGLPHVNEVSKGLGTVTLEFINTTNSQAFFEYRIDSQTAGTTPHPVVTGDVIHPGVCVDGRTPPECDSGPVTRTFTANTLVEIRLALGGERNWDFDWTPFTVGQQGVPTSKRDCKRGGWEAFGFRNQGQCIKFVKNADDGSYDDHEEDNGDKDHDDRKDRKDRNDRNDRDNKQEKRDKRSKSRRG